MIKSGNFSYFLTHLKYQGQDSYPRDLVDKLYITPYITCTYDVFTIVLKNCNSYNLDDSSQPDKAKNVPQQHAVQLAEGSAGFPSDVPPKAGQLHLAFVKAKQIGNIESIKCDIKDGDFVKLITAKDLQDYNIRNNFQPEDAADEKIVEEIICSKEGLFRVFGHIAHRHFRVF